MSSYPIGYVVTVFWYGDMTKYKYAGGGEWAFISGENTTARYKQMLNMIENN